MDPQTISALVSFVLMIAGRYLVPRLPAPAQKTLGAVLPLVVGGLGAIAPKLAGDPGAGLVVNLLGAIGGVGAQHAIAMPMRAALALPAPVGSTTPATAAVPEPAVKT